jgi:hypothetical protein
MIEKTGYSCNREDYDNDCDWIAAILRDAGYIVNNAMDGMKVGDGEVTIGVVVSASPDDDDDGTPMTDFFVGSDDESTDGHLYTFREGYPERDETLSAVNKALADERMYRNHGPH